MTSSREPKCTRPSGLGVKVTSLDLASLGGEICCITMIPDGTCIVCTGSALFAITKSGMQSLLAGHRMKTGFKDGQGGEEGVNCPQGITVDDNDNLLVSGTHNHALRKVTLSGPPAHCQRASR